MDASNTRRKTILASAGILVALVAANTAAWFVLRGVRIDATQEQLYSLSPGVREIMKSLPEPVRLDFYWTREEGADNPQIRSYAQRVQEFLEELAAASDGKIELRVVDPEPFSETEDMAKAAGIAPRAHAAEKKECAEADEVHQTVPAYGQWSELQRGCVKLRVD